MASGRVAGAVGGYDVTFVQLLHPDFECPVCLLAMRDPVQTPCGHAFCKSCFNQVARQQGYGDEATCPLDKQKFPVAKVFDDVKEHRKILNLEVKCMNKWKMPFGGAFNSCLSTCDWTGQLRVYEDHLKECKFEDVQCGNDCGSVIQRWAIVDHLAIHCIRRKVNCSHCAIEFEERERQVHLTDCPKLPVLCHLECGEKVERENMAWHVSESGNCPNALLSCPFKDAGCDIKEKRHQLGKHLTDNVVEHQLKQQQKISQLQDENKELKQKLVANEEHQLKQQQMISQLQQRLVANEGGLDSVMWNLLGFGPSNTMMLSRCGQALLRVSVELFPICYCSKPFLAHQSGYMATINVASRRKVLCEDDDDDIFLTQLEVSLKPAVGSSDDKLTWPFKIRHTIALIDQGDNTRNISKTIEPDKLDGSLAEYCFGVPSSLRAVNNELDMIPAMLSVPWSTFSGIHMRNNTIIICVQVDN